MDSEGLEGCETESPIRYKAARLRDLVVQGRVTIEDPPNPAIVPLYSELGGEQGSAPGHPLACDESHGGELGPGIAPV